MRKTSILNKLIHKPQAIHGGQRVCEENNELELELELEEKKTKSWWSILRWKDRIWKVAEEQWNYWLEWFWLQGFFTA